MKDWDFINMEHVEEYTSCCKVVHRCHAKYAETFIEICKREKQYMEGKLKTFRTQSLFNFGFHVDLALCSKRYQVYGFQRP